MVKKRKYVVMFRINNSNGYTLLSLIISLSILIFTTPLIVHFLNFILSIDSTYHQSDFELRQLHYYIQSEMNQSVEVHINHHSITFVKADGSRVKYELYKDLIRRRVNDTGHEVILRDVEIFEVKMHSENVFLIGCKKGDGHYYQRTYISNNTFTKLFQNF
ncbi:ComGF family competence protein [Piscibacillus halophilus]|nr:ComGF family competence protein [Piscibacillus halophilus]